MTPKFEDFSFLVSTDRETVTVGYISSGGVSNTEKVLPANNVILKKVMEKKYTISDLNYLRKLVIGS